MKVSYVFGFKTSSGKVENFSGGWSLENVEHGIRFHLAGSPYGESELFQEIRDELISEGRTSFASSQPGFEGLLIFAVESSKFNPRG